MEKARKVIISFLLLFSFFTIITPQLYADDYEKLIARLKQESEDPRIAVYTLADSKTQDSLPVLIKLLFSPEFAYKEAIIEAFHQLEDPRTIYPIIKFCRLKLQSKLHFNGAMPWNEIIKTLGDIGNTDAIPILQDIEKLKLGYSPYLNEIDRAIYNILKRGDHDENNLLMHALSLRKQEREVVIRHLEKADFIPDTIRIRGAYEYIKGNLKYCRRFKDTTLEFIRANLESNDPVIRMESLVWVEKLTLTDAIPDVVKRLEDWHWTIRKKALDLLYRYNWEPETEKEKIIWAINRYDWETVINYGDKATPYLLDLLQPSVHMTWKKNPRDVDENIREHSPYRIVYGTYPESEMETLASVIARIGSDAVDDLLEVDVMNEPMMDSMFQKSSFIKPLVLMGEAILPLLEKASYSTDYKVSIRAFTAICRTGSLKSLEFVKKWFVNNPVKFRSAIVTYMLNIGKRGFETMTEYIDHPNPQVRITLAHYLGKAEQKTKTIYLKKLSKDINRDVAEKAGYILERINNE